MTMWEKCSEFVKTIHNWFPDLAAVVAKWHGSEHFAFVTFAGYNSTGSNTEFHTVHCNYIKSQTQLKRKYYVPLMWPGQKLIFFASIKSDSNSYCIFCPLGTEQRYCK